MRLQFKQRWAKLVQGALPRRPASDQAARRGPPAPAPSIPVNAEWDEAFLRVESYLCAHQMESRVLLNQLTSEILRAARDLGTRHPDEVPVTLAMHIAHARIGEWLVHAVGEGDWTDERFRARGRLAMLLAEIPQRCPERFLSPDGLPPEVIAQFARWSLQPGPELRLSGMAAAPLEFSLAATAGKHWETFSRSAFFRASSIWILITGFLGAAWLITR